ncbi:ATP-binding protein [Rossellomorea oryzaecorticis]|uniref:ATP-binding protein n=1 Tax=Rossellomorea oryzaecorticis TaxID=1396505 RepID=A0ABU9K4Y0_9BACI
MTVTVSLKDVFGVSKNILKSYVLRPEIDNEFEDKLVLTDHHLVVFGETKVGKSHLRKKYIPENKDVVVVDCTKGVSLSEIYTQILYKANIELTDSLSRSIEEGSRLTGEIQANFLQFLKSKLSGELSEKEITTEIVKPPIPSTVSVRLADELKKAGVEFIVLDDFHYLNLIEQYLLAYDLKMFYQSGLRFIIIGTKISSGYFEKFNGELSQRIDYIDATKWSVENLREIQQKGCHELNIGISDEIVDYFISTSSGIVAVYQALLFDYCRMNEIKKTVTDHIVLDNLELARECNLNYWKNYSEMYFKKIQDIAGGGRRRKLQLYYYIMVVVMNSSVEVLRKGFPFQYLFEKINEIHPLKTSLNQGSLTSVLNHIDDLQVDKDIFPKVFTYYDKRLYVVDSVFYYIMQHFPPEKIDEILPPHEYEIKLGEISEDAVE